MIASIDTIGYDLYPGDIFIAFPNKIHSYKSFSESECSSLIILSACLFPEYGKILKDSEPECPVIKKEQVPEDVVTILERAMRDHNMKNEYRDKILKGNYLIFLRENPSAVFLQEKKKRRYAASFCAPSVL